MVSICLYGRWFYARTTYSDILGEREDSDRESVEYDWPSDMGRWTWKMEIFSQNRVDLFQ